MHEGLQENAMINEKRKMKNDKKMKKTNIKIQIANDKSKISIPEFQSTRRLQWQIFNH